MAGFGFGMIYMPSIIIMGFYFEKWRAVATSIVVTGSAVGTIAFPPLFNILLKEYTWRQKFRMISALSLCLTLCGATYRPVKQTRILRQTPSQHQRPPIRMDMHSMASTFTSSYAVKQIFSRNHNLSYPTNADVLRQGNYSIYDPSPDSSEVVISPSDSSLKTTGLSFSPMDEYSGRLDIIPEEDEASDRRGFCCSRCCRKRRAETPFRPMYRDDVFFTGSAAAVSQYSTGKSFRDVNFTSKHYYFRNLSCCFTTNVIKLKLVIC